MTYPMTHKFLFHVFSDIHLSQGYYLQCQRKHSRLISEYTERELKMMHFSPTVLCSLHVASELPHGYQFDLHSEVLPLRPPPLTSTFTEEAIIMLYFIKQHIFGGLII